MGNQIYDNARRRLLTADLDWQTIELMLVPWDGVPDFVATDTKINNITARGALPRGYSDPITSQTVTTTGIGQTNLILIPDVEVGPDISWFTMCERKPVLSESELILFIDTGLDMPFTPNGLDLLVTPDWLSRRGWFKP